MKTAQAAAMIAILAIMASPSYALLGGQSFGRVDFDDDEITEAEIEIAETTFSRPGVLPDNPLYFLKRINEGVSVALTLDEEERNMLHLEFAKKRIAEAKKLVEENKIDKAVEQIESFEKEIEIVARSSAEADAQILATSAGEEKQSETAKEAESIAGKSALILGIVSEGVPEDAKLTLEEAITNSVESKIKAEKRIKIKSRSKAEIKSGTDDEDDSKKREAESKEEAEKRRGEIICAQVVTRARNPATDEVKEFPTPCDVPEGWVKIEQFGEFEVERSRREGDGEKIKISITPTGFVADKGSRLIEIDENEAETETKTEIKTRIDED